MTNEQAMARCVSAFDGYVRKRRSAFSCSLAPMRYPKDLALAVADLLDSLARNVPEIAAECVTCSDALKRYAGPSDPPPPPPG